MGCKQILEQLLVLNESSITNVIAALMLTLGVNGPLEQKLKQFLFFELCRCSM